MKMLSLNAFGMPEVLQGETYRKHRINAIAEKISHADYDLYLLQEVWIKSDYDIIRNAIPPNYKITSFEDFNDGKCVVTEQSFPPAGTCKMHISFYYLRFYGYYITSLLDK